MSEREYTLRGFRFYLNLAVSVVFSKITMINNKKLFHPITALMN